MPDFNLAKIKSMRLKGFPLRRAHNLSYHSDWFQRVLIFLYGLKPDLDRFHRWHLKQQITLYSRRSGRCIRFSWVPDAELWHCGRLVNFWHTCFLLLMKMKRKAVCRSCASSYLVYRFSKTIATLFSPVSPEI